MTMKSTILVVEDEKAIRLGVVDVLVYHGFRVDSAEDGLSGLSKSLTGQYDLILLDVMLPGINGFEICQKIRRKHPEQAIIMLTAKTTDEDIIAGLTSGADDYVAKPFSVAQLVLRIKAVLRRAKIHTVETGEIALSSTVKIDTLNLNGRIEGVLQVFTRKEIDIMQYLFQHNERPVSREELLNKVWGYDKELELETRTVDIHVAKIRRKIEQDPAYPKYLVTVRGAGYRMLVSKHSK